MKKELEIFPNIPKLILFTIISLIFILPLYISPNSFFNFNNLNFKSIILILGTILFTFSFLFFLYSIILFNKPLLIIYSDRIIIKHHLRKNRVIYFKNVKDFSLFNQTHRGFKTNTLILIEMNLKYKNSIFYKISSFLFIDNIIFILTT
ncbi:STM3941 family protein [Chishuiella sp.]|uniref:STM3941 family protein n=1 Tax=Chishuiella sp. TaxID=1969467 RepID=UPI00391DACE2